MSWETKNTYSKSNDVEKCTNCGATYEVDVPAQGGHMESEEYFCPECSKGYSTRASMSPRVTLITGRTDGKTDRYDNTEWLKNRGYNQ